MLNAIHFKIDALIKERIHKEFFTNAVIAKSLWLNLHLEIKTLQPFQRLVDDGRRRLGVQFIHLFIFICLSSTEAALMLYCHSTVPYICKDDISASTIFHLYMYILVV